MSSVTEAQDFSEDDDTVVASGSGIGKPSRLKINAWTAPVISQEERILEKYKDYPLLQSMLRHEETRRNILDRNGSKQRNYTKSTDGWIRTMITVEGRALDNFFFPWILCTLNSIVWTVLGKTVLSGRNAALSSSWEFFFGIVLNTSLSFLLVFRLNRAAERFWLARENWGTIVGVGRYLASGILVHGAHRPVPRDKAIRWICGFTIATMQYIRSIECFPPESLAGILSEDEIFRMERSAHSPIYAAYQVREAMSEIFRVSEDTPHSIASAWTQQMGLLEQSLNKMMDQEGAMERIRSSPLPLVYVAHLRTFLLGFLLALPYIWQATWGWATIPIASITSFALLGLEGAAAECEAPFQRGRPNHLNMDGFCLLLINNVQQSLHAAADLDLGEKKSRASRRVIL